MAKRGRPRIVRENEDDDEAGAADGVAAGYEAEEVLDTPRRRQVEVNEVTRRRYIDEEALPGEVVQEVTEPATDPFAIFNEILTTDQTARLRIWYLPFYEIDGRSSPRNNEGRRYVSQIDYDPRNADMVLEQIRARVPQGGTVQLELLVNGQITKRGLLQIMKSDRPINSIDSNPPAYPVPGAPSGAVAAAPVAPADPLAMVRSQIDFAKEMINVAKDLLPPPAPPLADNNSSERPLQDRLLEAVVLKAFEADKIPADRFTDVVAALSGHKQEPSLVATALETIGPHVGTFLTQIGSGVNAWLLRVAGAGAPAGPVTATATGAVAPPEQLPEDPGQHAYMRVVHRMVDDLLEHCACVARGMLGIDPYSSAEAVADLLNRFSQHEMIVTTTSAMLAVDTTPEQVIGLCSMMFAGTPVHQRLIEAQTNPAALEWVGTLQTAAREILSGGENSEPGESTGNSEPPTPRD